MPLSKHQQISLAHVLIFVPILFYFGLAQGKAPNWAFWTLFVIASLGVLYHLMRYIQTNSQINLFHVVAVFPLLIYVGLAKKKTPDFAFLVVFALAVAALWYHGKHLFQ